MEDIKRKTIVQFIVLCMIMVLSGCGNETVKDNNDYNNNSQLNNETKYDEIKITIDNWQDYFEMANYEISVKNEFGDVRDIYKESFLVLKNNYVFSKDRINELSVEITYDVDKQYYSFDKNEGKIEWLETEVYQINQSKTMTISNGISDTWTINGNTTDKCILLAQGIGGGGTYDGKEFQHVEKNIVINRIEGILYLSK